VDLPKLNSIEFPEYDPDEDEEWALYTPCAHPIVPKLKIVDRNIKTKIGEFVHLAEWKQASKNRAIALNALLKSADITL